MFVQLTGQSWRTSLNRESSFYSYNYVLCEKTYSWYHIKHEVWMVSLSLPILCLKLLLLKWFCTLWKILLLESDTICFIQQWNMIVHVWRCRVTLGTSCCVGNFYVCMPLGAVSINTLKFSYGTFGSWDKQLYWQCSAAVRKSLKVL